MEGYVLGIDPGTTNFAFALTDVQSHRVVAVRSVKLQRSDTNVAIAMSVCALLGALARGMKVIHVAVEQQLRQPMIEICQSVVTWAYTQNISCEVVSAYTWRRRVGARNKKSWAANKKNSVDYCCWTLGYPVQDHNLAEAIMISLGATAHHFSPRPDALL